MIDLSPGTWVRCSIEGFSDDKRRAFVDDRGNTVKVFDPDSKFSGYCFVNKSKFEVLEVLPEEPKNIPSHELEFSSTYDRIDVCSACGSMKKLDLGAYHWKGKERYVCMNENCPKKKKARELVE